MSTSPAAIAALLTLAACVPLSSEWQPDVACVGVEDGLWTSGKKVSKRFRTYELDDLGRTIRDTTWRSQWREQPESVREWIYRGDLLVEQTDDLDGDGDVDLRTAWTYSDRGLLITTAQAAYGAFTNENGPTGLLSRTTYLYNELGQRIEEQHDTFGDGTVERSYQYQWRDGRTITSQQFADTGRTLVATSTWDYDGPAPNADYVLTGVSEPDGIVQTVWRRRFDNNGYPSYERNQLFGLDIDFEVFTEYTPAGELLVQQTVGGDATESLAFFYDSDGRVVTALEDHDDNSDGIPEFISTASTIWTCDP